MSADYDESSILSVLKYIREKCGETYLTDSRKLRSTTLDLAPGLRNEIRHFCILAENGYIDDYIRANGRDEYEKRAVSNRTKLFLLNDYIQKDRAEYCIAVLEAVFGWRSEKSVNQLPQGGKYHSLIPPQNSKSSLANPHPESGSAGKKVYVNQNLRNSIDVQKRNAEFNSIFTGLKSKSDNGKRFNEIFDGSHKDRKYLYSIATDSAHLKALDDFFSMYDENLAVYQELVFHKGDSNYIQQICSANQEYQDINRRLNTVHAKITQKDDNKGSNLLNLVLPLALLLFHAAVIKAQESVSGNLVYLVPLFLLCTCLITGETIVLLLFAGGKYSEKEGMQSAIISESLYLISGIIPSLFIFAIVMESYIKSASDYQDGISFQSIINCLPSWVYYTMIAATVISLILLTFVFGIKFGIVSGVVVIAVSDVIFKDRDAVTFLPETVNQIMGPFMKGALITCAVCMIIRSLVILKDFIKGSSYRNLIKVEKEYYARLKDIKLQIFQEIYDKYSEYVDESYLLNWKELTDLKNSI